LRYTIRYLYSLLNSAALLNSGAQRLRVWDRTDTVAVLRVNERRNCNFKGVCKKTDLSFAAINIKFSYC
jgi:hypothetical protein